MDVIALVLVQKLGKHVSVIRVVDLLSLTKDHLLGLLNDLV